MLLINFTTILFSKNPLYAFKKLSLRAINCTSCSYCSLKMDFSLKYIKLPNKKSYFFLILYTTHERFETSKYILYPCWIKIGKNKRISCQVIHFSLTCALFLSIMHIMKYVFIAFLGVFNSLLLL